MAIKMQIRRGTLAAWTAAGNPTLIAGELGFVTDVGKTAFKIGDGALAWDLLPYVNSTYPEFTPSADLNLAITQGRYPLSSGVTYTSSPTLTTEFVQGVANDGDSILTVTVPSSGIVIQQINTSLTAKQFLRARNVSTWTAWKRIDTLAATDSLSITNLTLSGDLTVGGIISVPDGSAAAPSITNTGDTDTGLYFPAGDNQVGITTLGVSRAIFGTTAAISSPITVTGSIAATGSGGSITASQNISGVGIIAGSSGIISASGLTVQSGPTSLTVPVVIQTAASAAGTVFSTKNTSGTVVTTIRGDGAPTAGTDLTTKSYVDTAVSAVTFREMMIIAVDNSDTNYIIGGTVVTGVVNNSLSIRIISVGATAPGVTFASNLASSTVTWTTGVPSGVRRCLFPSAGTWSVACGVGVNGAGLSFTAIRTA